MCNHSEVEVNASDVEVSLRLATYSKDQQNICFTDRIQIEESGRIQFSIVAQIKQKRLMKEQELKLDLLFFKEPQQEKREDEEKKDTVLLSQQISKIPLESLPLFRDKGEGITKKLLIRDAWKVRQNIKINLSEVPIKDVGNYAVVAYLGKPKETVTSYPADLIFLDCVYFEVFDTE